MSVREDLFSMHGLSFVSQPSGAKRIPTLPLPPLAITIILLLFIAENIVKQAAGASEFRPYRRRVGVVRVESRSLRRKVQRTGHVRR